MAYKHELEPVKIKNSLTSNQMTSATYVNHTGALSNNSQPAREFKQMFTLCKSNSPASGVVLFSKFEYSDSEGAFATETNFHDKVSGT